MRKFAYLSAVVTTLTLVLVSRIQAQAPPKPGPEMEHLKQMEGSWDAVVKAGGQEFKGTSTYKVELGGHWLVSKFKADMFGQPFHGQGLDGYDQAKKKYVSIWVDSMSTAPIISEGTYDTNTNTMTMTGTGPDEQGQPAKYKMVSQFKDKDHWEFTLSKLDGDNANQMMTISYTRRK